MKGAGRFWGSLTNAEASRAWLGAIAQLGERVLCKHEVVGSIPSGSTIFLALATRVPRAGRQLKQYPCLKRQQFRSEQTLEREALIDIVKRD